MKHLLPVLALLLFPACAAMQQQMVDTYCNADGAYQKGFNDGHDTGRMNNGFAAMCPSDQDAIRHSYRDGFEKGLAQRNTEPVPATPPPEQGSAEDGWQCREAYGQKVCGYHCLESYGKIRCAGNPYDTCVAAYGNIKCGCNCHEDYGDIKCDSESDAQGGWECRDHFGENICGYHCVESYGQVKCAQRPFHNCVAAYGTIKCGRNCREEDGEIKCERYE